MEEIRQLLANPVWWVSTVFVTIIVNILSSYLRDMLDRLIEKVIAATKATRAKQEVAETSFIEGAILDPKHITDLEIRAMAYGSTAGRLLLVSLLTGIVFVVVVVDNRVADFIASYSPLLLLLTAFALAIMCLTSLIIGLHFVGRSTKAFDLASEARGRRYEHWYDRIIRERR